MFTIGPRAKIQDFWSQKHRASLRHGCQRFKAIERFISLNSQPEYKAKADGHTQWYWKIQHAVNAVRTRFHEVLVPGSHICVGESIIKFHGRNINAMKLQNKPARHGFTCYVLTSHGGLAHDWVMHSSQRGLEGVP